MEVFLACVAAARVNPSRNNEEARRSCSTYEDEREEHWLTPRVGADACHANRLVK